MKPRHMKNPWGLAFHGLSPFSAPMTESPGQPPYRVHANSGEALLQTPANFTGAYGSFTFDESGGAWHRSRNNSDSDDSVLTTTSAAGAAWQTIVVAVTGPNDAAAIND